MRVIKIKPEYGCFPIWLYDEDGLFIDNRLPHKNVQNRHAVKAAFVKVQEAYEKLFVNNDSEFSYIGFSSEEQKAQFTEQFNSAAELLSKAVGDKYIIVNAVDLEKMQKE
ncbi:MAG: hypothetical protein II931_03450 [Clostridia bacterium]|nr:hypothetical protein [Clostridia bacterium]